MDKHYDVIIAGGGSAGVAAAVGASRAGARTLLLEKGPCLGGAATLRNVVTYAGIFTQEDQRQVVFGVMEDVYARLREIGAVSEPRKYNAVTVVFEPEDVKFVLDELCAESGVHVRLHTLIVGAEADAAGTITAVRVADHEGIHQFTAGAFVDATGDADLAHHSGAEVRYGRDGKVQNGTLGVRFGGIPLEVDAGRAALKKAVTASKTAGVPNLLAETGLVARLPVSGDIITYLVDEGYDARSAMDTSRAEAHARLQAQAYLQALKTVPGCENAYIVSTGPELGTRESRHVVAPLRLTEEDVLLPKPRHDAVAIGAWPMEYHPGPGVPSIWKFIADPGYFGIPLDCLRSVNRTNLFAAGRLLDGDQAAGSSLRVMGTAFATGHASGIAAAQTALGRTCDTYSVQTELQRQDARLPIPVTTAARPEVAAS
ncbi:FAD-dependent oxidoreductase [Pseudarthrobacter sp. BRE9]|uniref:FAD-dependent oxidoreductase n=1 Tax=Pseudarthrobacter sp. BRE9 TaxID=2962582 RepID=UPI002880D17F|nr:FAD-dependent oxidoreductase [Pseudarthrobacter sp. BRE9]MDT0169467.1 FAD-dependent oxidoreductase [Pseudarthrobacter sp. BRE9]